MLFPLSFQQRRKPANEIFPIVNCTGLGAGELAQDAVFPVRGALVRVRKPRPADVAQPGGRRVAGLNELAWQVVRRRDCDQEAYARSLRLAAAAVREEPKVGYILNTQGVAQYRVGQNAAALATLTESEKLNTVAFEGTYPGDAAFLAMAQHQLGKKDEAKATLARLREVMKQPRWAKDAEAQSFLREAEELIEGKPTEKQN
jgi:hypothetical protein